MTASLVPPSLMGLVLQGPQNEGRITLKIQAFSPQNPPENCFGRYAGNKWCYSCARDGECRQALTITIRFNVPAPMLVAKIKKIEG